MADLVAGTPPGRDRYVDLLRAGSMLAVMFGHWFISVIERDGDDIEGTNVLAAGLGATDLTERTVHRAARIASQPLWFLAVYLVVTALAPVLLRAHQRSPWATVAGLATTMVLLDVGRLAFDRPGPAAANYLVVFLFAQQLGFAYGDGRLLAVPRRWLLGGAATAIGLLALLTGPGPYPTSMVGVPGDDFSNMSPPTICIAVLTVAQVGVVMALRPAARRWLERPRAWTAVVAANARIMTLFLWHLTALAFAALALLALGVPTPDPGSAGWWALRPVWMLAAAAVLAGFVAAFGWAESPRVGGRELRPAPAWPAAVGLVVAVSGLIGLALSGFDRPLEVHGASFAGLRFAPVGSTAMVLVGWAAIRGIRRPPRAA